MIKRIKLLRGFATVGFWTLLSRILGFVRDILFAAFLGTGPVAEAFLIAFSLPNMFRRLFAEGAFNMAFVPMYSKKLSAGDDANLFADEAFSLLGSFLIVFALVAQVAMPVLVAAMASGFIEDGRFEIAVYFGRIVFPYVVFISLAALISGVLNAAGRFAAAAAAPVLLNLLFIVAIALAARNGWHIGKTLSWTAPFAGVAQLLLVWLAAHRAGFPIRIRLPKLTPELKRLAIIALPAALAGGVTQVNLLVGRQVASFFDGAVAWLNYADRLYQLPLGVVGIAIGVVLLPDLSRKLATRDSDGGRDAFNRACEAAMGLALPAAAAFAIVPIPIVGVLFERGSFEQSDTLATAAALAIYAFGLPAFVLQKVFQPLYFAREDTRTPFRYAVVAMLVNLVVAVGFAKPVGYLAAAFGTTISAWVMIFLLWKGSREMGNAARFDTRLLRTLPRIAAATAVMGLALYYFAEFSSVRFDAEGIRYVALLALVVAGVAIYGICLLIFGVIELKKISTLFKRRKK